MTLALETARNGAGVGEFGFSPPFILAPAGGRSWRPSLDRAEEDGAPTAGKGARSLLLTSPTSLPPAHSVPFPRNPTNDLASLPPWAALAERSEPGNVGEGSSRRLPGLGSLATPFSMPGTSDPFPTPVWLRGGVGRDVRVGRAGW